MKKSFDNLETLFKAVKRTVDKRDLHDAIGGELVDLTDENFENEKTPGGTKWKALEPATLKARRQGPRPGTGGILEDSGALRGSIGHLASDQKSILGSGRPYAAVHDRGWAKLNIPARSFFPSRKIPKRYQSAIQAVMTSIMEEAT